MADTTTIDQLEIQISAEATQAAKQIKDFAASLRGSATALSQTAKDLKAVAQGAKEASSATSKGKTEVEGLNKTLEDTGKSGEEASDSLEKTGKSAKNAGNEAAKASGKFRTLLGDIMRIAKYRAIRTFIKGLTTAIKEGFNMFATWDKESNNGLARVAGNVAAVTEKWTILKGQLGAAAGALFNSFAPVITFILDGLTKIVDVFQMVIRSLQGEYTYYHLIYKEAEATTGAAKELKRVLFGFDDLNVLPSQTGGGAAITNGTWAYEELPITSEFLNKIADGSNKLKEFFGISDEGQDILGGLTGVLGVLLGGKALGGLLGLLPRLIGGFKNKNKVLGEQSTKTATETSKVTQLATAFGLATGAAFGLKELLKNWKINIPTTVQDPVPQAQQAYSNAQKVFDRPATIPVNVASATEGAKATRNNAQKWLTANPLKIGTKLATQAFSDLSEAISGASLGLALNPLNIGLKINLFTQGLANALGETLDTLQSQADLNPIIVKVIQQGEAYTPTTAKRSDQWGAEEKKLSSISSLYEGNAATARLKHGKSNASNAVQLTASDISILDKIEQNALANGIPSFKQQIAAAGLKIPEPIYNNIYTFAVNEKRPTLKQLLENIPMNPAYSGSRSMGTNFVSTFLSQLLQAIALPVVGRADGGIPDVGTLFYAGEAGAEVVANLGHSTGVTNVDQMADAVAEGNASVVEALYAVLRAIQSKDSNVYLDGAKIGQSVSRYQQNQARRGVAYNG